MAVDDRGERNRPIYAGVGAPADAEDLTYLGRLITELGTRRVGTSTERENLESVWMFDGLEWFETDTGISYRVKGGIWTVTTRDSDWLDLPSKSGNFRADNSAGYRLKDGLIHYRGQLTKIVSGTATNIADTDGLFTMPTGLTAGSVKLWNLVATPGNAIRATMLLTGRVQIAHPGPPTSTYVILDDIPPYPVPNSS